MWSLLGQYTALKEHVLISISMILLSQLKISGVLFLTSCLIVIHGQAAIEKLILPDEIDDDF